MPKIPNLSHGLESVVRSGDVKPVFVELDPIVQPKDIDYAACPAFITSSLDQTLHTTAKDLKVSFKGSTSSLTSLLSQMYFGISRHKALDVSYFSPGFASMRKDFTPGAKLPARVFLHRSDGMFAIDAASERNPPNVILLELGKSMERMLTLDSDLFRQLVVRGACEPENRPDDPYPESSYVFLQVGDFLVRSQLDCVLSCSGKVFDLKTRATHAIRYDVENYAEHVNYHITRVSGTVKSFEREFYDMLRSAFLKYAFQLRIGQMDGAFVVYHNTKQIFGAQYLPLPLIESCTFGSTTAARTAMDYGFKLLSEILHTVAQMSPNSESIATTLGYSAADACLWCNFYHVPNEVRDETIGNRIWAPEQYKNMQSLRIHLTRFLDSVVVSSPNLDAPETFDLCYRIEQISPDVGYAYEKASNFVKRSRHQ